MRCVANELCWIKSVDPGGHLGNAGRVVRTVRLRPDWGSEFWSVWPEGQLWVQTAFGWQLMGPEFPSWIESFVIEDSNLLPFRNLGDKDLQVPAPQVTYEEARRRAWDEIAKTDDRLREYERKARLVCPKDGGTCLYGRRGICAKCGREVGPNELRLER